VGGSRLYRVSAVVIRQRNLGEADRVLTLLTRENGKISAVARGVKKARSKLAPSLQLFAQARMQLAVGRSLDVITSAHPVDLYYHLREDVQRYAYASYVAELADALLEEGGPDESVFTLLVATLKALDGGADAATVTLGFEIKLLTRLGYGPEVAACVSCGRQVEGGGAGFSAAEGGVMCAKCRRAEGAKELSGAGLRGLRELLAIPQEEVAGRKLAARVRQELQSMMRAFVDYRVDRPLRSAAFLGP
jgi:DNA repair protein RecO (recombination protein O)